MPGYNNDPNPSHGSASDQLAYARMARNPHGMGGDHARTLTGAEMLRDGIELQSQRKTAERRARRRAGEITFIKRVVLVIACFVALLTGVVATYVVVTVVPALSRSAPAVVRLVPERAVCEWVYVRRC